MLRKIIYSLSISLVLFTPFVYSNELYNGVISAKQIWLYGAMAVLMLITAVDLLFCKQSFVLKINKIDLALLVFYTYYTIRAAASPYMPLLYNQRWINWTLCVILYFIIKMVHRNQQNNSYSLPLSHLWLKKSTHTSQQMTSNDSFSSDAQQLTTNDRSANDILRPNDASQIKSFIINFLILTALAQSIWGLLQLYGFLPSFNSNFKITGTFFNPAPYALYIAIIFPLALGNVLFNERFKAINQEAISPLIFKFSNWLIFKLPYFLSFATVIAILLVLPATMIRAAWFGAFAGVLVVLQYKYHCIQQIKQFLNTRIKQTAAVAIAIAVVTSLAFGIYHLKKDSANSKLFIWEVTMGKIIEKPLFGYGIGRFEAEYNNWQAEYFQKRPQEMAGLKGWEAGNTKYCFNEFLETTSETGIIGLMFLGSLLVLAFGWETKLKMNELKIKNEKRFDTFPFISSFLIILFFSFPFYNIPVLLTFFVILAVISVNKQTVTMPLFKHTFIVRYSFVTILLVLGGCFGFALPKNNTAYKTWENAHFLYVTSNYKESITEFKKVNTLFKFNNEFLQEYGKCLAMNKDFAKAKIILNEAGKFGGDYMLYVNLGDVNKELKLYQQAEFAYKVSANMVPHKLYPHYLLAKLYLQSGDSAKAKTKAEEVLAMNAKINNMVEYEIKQEMKHILMKEVNY